MIDYQTVRVAIEYRPTRDFWDGRWIVRLRCDTRTRARTYLTHWGAARGKARHIKRLLRDADKLEKAAAGVQLIEREDGTANPAEAETPPSAVIFSGEGE